MSTTYGDMRTNAERIADERIKERVLAGIKVLDAWDPDWPSYVDPSILILSNTERCVLGQIFEDAEVTGEQWDYFERNAPTNMGSRDAGFFRGLAILDGDVCKSPARFGFDSDHESYTQLTNAWLTVFDGEAHDAEDEEW